MSQSLSEKTKRELMRYEWREGVFNDASLYKKAWLGHNLPWFQSVESFLATFGGFEHYSKDGELFQIFDPSSVKDFIDEIDCELEKFGGTVKPKLCPIGAIAGSVLIYSSNEEYIFFSGIHFQKLSLSLYEIGFYNFLNKYFDSGYASA
jgi:SUKH-3 immunity protein